MRIITLFCTAVLFTACAGKADSGVLEDSGGSDDSGSDSGDTGDGSGGDTSLDDITPTFSTTLVGTNQTLCYDAAGEITCPDTGADFYGQDAQHAGASPTYTVTDDLVRDDLTGLVWQRAQIDGMAWSDAEAYCGALDLGGRTDWRVPSTKELYSLIDFSGSTGNGSNDYSEVPDNAVPYIDTDAFDFSYGDVSAGERYIDTQFITTTVYVSMVFADDHGESAGQEAFFGVNLADGRIKGYPTGTGTYQLRCVSGHDSYGANDLEDQGDGTVMDHATGRMWTQTDSAGLGAGPEGTGTLDWPSALEFCEDLDLAGHTDWRLPDAKELQALVDYSRSPDTTGSAAISAVFDATPIVNEAGDDDFGWYWSSTTHLDGMVMGADAIYVAFGQALGYAAAPGESDTMFMDVHGAGAQRGDPKVGSPDEYPQWGMGPQGDVRRVHNLARCVRTAE